MSVITAKPIEELVDWQEPEVPAAEPAKEKTGLDSLLPLLLLTGGLGKGGGKSASKLLPLLLIMGVLGENSSDKGGLKELLPLLLISGMGRDGEEGNGSLGQLLMLEAITGML